MSQLTTGYTSQFLLSFEREASLLYSFVNILASHAKIYEKFQVIKVKRKLHGNLLRAQK
jgi:hypothetical protein